MSSVNTAAVQAILVMNVVHAYSENLRQLNTSLWYVILNKVFSLHIKEKAEFSELPFPLRFSFFFFPFFACMYAYLFLLVCGHICVLVRGTCVSRHVEL